MFTLLSIAIFASNIIDSGGNPDNGINSSENVDSQKMEDTYSLESLRQTSDGDLADLETKTKDPVILDRISQVRQERAAENPQG